MAAMSAEGGAPEQEIKKGAVNVLTMHRAKGLSARTVIVMAAEDEYLPGRQQGVGQEDERRLLYVSLTRARSRLLITYSTSRTGQQRFTGRSGGKPGRILSRYLADAPVRPEDGEASTTGLVS
jgi:DNA helicase-2/ATP-dependent DNA helicase PcrA